MSINACTINAFTINGLCNIPFITPPEPGSGGGSTYYPRFPEADPIQHTVCDRIIVNATLCGYSGQDAQDICNDMMPMVYVSNINIEDIEFSVTVKNIRKEND